MQVESVVICTYHQYDQTTLGEYGSTMWWEYVVLWEPSVEKSIGPKKDRMTQAVALDRSTRLVGILFTYCSLPSQKRLRSSWHLEKLLDSEGELQRRRKEERKILPLAREPPGKERGSDPKRP